MRLTPIVAIVSCLGIATGGCARKETQKKEIETKTVTAKDTGEKVQSQTEVKQDTPSGKVVTENESYVGTVTHYKPGRKIEVKSEDGRSHSFNLKERGAVVTVKPSIRIGTKVQVVVDKRENNVRKITIAPHA